MSHTYYYFAASLPMVTWGSDAGITCEDFLSECQRLLTQDDYAIVKRVVEDKESFDETGNRTADAWIRFDRDLRNELAWFRAQRVNKNPWNYLRTSKANNPHLRGIIHKASKMPNLLEAEKLLDQACWRFLEEVAREHYYDLDYLIVYGLKLKICQRHQEYNSSKGRNIFDEMRMMDFPESCVLAKNVVGISNK